MPSCMLAGLCSLRPLADAGDGRAAAASPRVPRRGGQPTQDGARWPMLGEPVWAAVAGALLRGGSERPGVEAPPARPGSRPPRRRAVPAAARQPREDSTRATPVCTQMPCPATRLPPRPRLLARVAVSAGLRRGQHRARALDARRDQGQPAGLQARVRRTPAARGGAPRRRWAPRRTQAQPAAGWYADLWRLLRSPCRRARAARRSCGAMCLVHTATTRVAGCTPPACCARAPHGSASAITAADTAALCRPDRRSHERHARAPRLVPQPSRVAMSLATARAPRCTSPAAGSGRAQARVARVDCLWWAAIVVGTVEGRSVNVRVTLSRPATRVSWASIESAGGWAPRTPFCVALLASAVGRGRGGAGADPTCRCRG